MNETISQVAMTSATILIKKGIAENLKEEALHLAQLYGSNIQIQIDIKRDSGIALVRITEYNV
jgi:hypothetical protein